LREFVSNFDFQPGQPKLHANKKIHGPFSFGNHPNMEVHMAGLSLENVCELLGTDDPPGSAKELTILCNRIRELVELNGEAWVRQNRGKLLDEWNYIVQQQIIT